MFFREYCEFIEALYIIYYSKMDDYEKKLIIEESKTVMIVLGKETMILKKFMMR